METLQQKKTVLFRLGVVLLALILSSSVLVIFFYLASKQWGP